MEVKHVDQLTCYRHMLRLPNELWRYADENNMAYKEVCKREKSEFQSRLWNSPASDIVDPNNILSDRAYQKKFAKIWRDMTQKRRIYRGDIHDMRQWFENLESEYATDDPI